MSTPDITVLGGGVFGLSIAWACAKRGARVRVIEKRKIGAGSSGGIVGALAPHTPENWNDKKQFQFDSLILSRDWWPEVEAISGMDTGYRRGGRIQPVLGDRELALAQNRADNAKTLWKGQADWQLVQTSGSTWEPPSPTGWLIQDTLSAQIHPRKAVAALAQAIRRKGGEIIEGEASLAGQVVEATGYEGLLALSDQMRQPFGNGVKGQAILVEFDAPDQPQLFADAMHFIPHGDGTVAIGSTSERVYTAPDQTDDQLAELHARAIRAVPALAEAPVIHRWAGVRPRAKSRAPVIGVHPLRPDRFIANGGFKIGFGMAPKLAEMMADLVLEGDDQIPASFRPEACLR